MKRTTRALCLFTAALLSGTAIAAPQYLITHNTTNVESNAYIDDVIPSRHPTKANTTNKVLWGLVKLACVGRVVNDQCKAMILMETNTNHPVELGQMSMNLKTGEISPASGLRKNGYALSVNGPGEVTLSQDKS
ncbi:MAG: hypothetical protein JJT82_00845 [Legionellaceae bacterium]|nr:hypothetical protein [Legionellaceae bacterium]